jgi:predicted transcriptional regulator
MRTEIISNLLEASAVGIRKTRLMYATNLSYQLLVKYTRALVEDGLLTYDGDLYYITTKGAMLLEKLKNYGELSEKLKQVRIELSKEYNTILSSRAKV